MQNDRILYRHGDEISVLPTRVQVYESPSSPSFTAPSIFLAGGIDQAPNWQAEAIKLIYEKSKIVLNVFNPRRSERFTTEDYNGHWEQVTWEFEHLRKANVIIFWFPENAPCTTSLFELGYWLGRCPEKVVMGINPQHYKERSIKTQIELLSKELFPPLQLTEVYDSLDKVISRAITLI